MWLILNANACLSLSWIAQCVVPVFAFQHWHRTFCLNFSTPKRIAFLTVYALCYEYANLAHFSCLYLQRIFVVTRVAHDRIAAVASPSINLPIFIWIFGASLLVVVACCCLNYCLDFCFCFSIRYWKSTLFDFFALFSSRTTLIRHTRSQCGEYRLWPHNIGIMQISENLLRVIFMLSTIVAVTGTYTHSHNNTTHFCS